jgi:hypothetical protein
MWCHTDRYFPVSESLGWYWQYLSARSKVKCPIYQYYKHTAFSWGCYGRLPQEEKNITRDEVEGDIFSECGNLP